MQSRFLRIELPVFPFRIGRITSIIHSDLNNVINCYDFPQCIINNSINFSFLTFYYKAKLFIEKQKVDQIQEMLSSKFQVIDKIEEYNVRFPIAYHTVDIAILKKLNHLSTEPTTPETHLLLIQKPNETSWRFPGGFVDPSDNSAEHAAIREAHEEVGRELELSKPQYITSVKIDDPRYKNSPHKIITSFYVVNYLWGKEKAGDDAEKAEWFNHQYLQRQSDENLLAQFKNLEEAKHLTISDEKLLKVIGLMKERATFVKDIYEQGKFFFEAPNSYDEKASKKAWNEETSGILNELLAKLNNTDFTSEILKEETHHFVEEKGLGFGKVMMPLRLSLVGELKGPDVPDLLEILGREESLGRIIAATENLK